MAKIKWFFLFVIVLMTLPHAEAQTETFLKPGILRAQGAFAIGHLPKYSATHIYLKGDLSYYIDKRFSLRADSYFFVDSQDNDNKPYNTLNSLFVGGSYHYGSGGKFDPYVGAQTGVAHASKNYMSFPSSDPNYGFSPLISAHAGLNYYAPKWFHLFVHLQYIHGTHTESFVNGSLNEWRLSFGLGWNLFLKD